MNDSISRQAAINALKNRWKKTRNYEGIGDDIAEECELYLKQVPSAQPEIIRCKDCKYNSNPPECGNAVCVLFYGMTDQMGFCHHGERRERE